MATSVNYPTTGIWSFINAPAILARRDLTHLLIFFAVNIIFGQMGIVGSVWLANNRSINIGSVIEQNLNTGAFITFSISLIVAAMGIIAVEFIDAARLKKDHVAQVEQKLAWGIVGLFVLLLSTLQAGSIISAELPEPDKSPPMSTSSTSAPQEVMTSAQPEIGPIVERHIRQTEKSTDWHQIFLWLASIVIATQLFCLYRVPLMYVSHADDRKEDVDKMAQQAQSKTKTSFNESL